MIGSEDGEKKLLVTFYNRPFLEVIVPSEPFAVAYNKWKKERDELRKRRDLTEEEKERKWYLEDTVADEENRQERVQTTLLIEMICSSMEVSSWVSDLILPGVVA